MDFEKLEAFIALARKNGVSSLEYEGGKEKYSVSFPVEDNTLKSIEELEEEISQIESKDVAMTTNSNKTVKEKDYLEITSPFVGTFYIAPSPGADPYVKIGERVEKGRVVCIVEAMKIMNEIESEISGEVLEVCVSNETPVEYGQVLLKLKP